ncbi:MAG TPA: BspA family leucine-rich repeat surface protein, partial [Treponemataceae bacterium]|nr:BspA family leucine-rich repeat surface protein [Treponemataceae bacterium]
CRQCILKTLTFGIMLVLMGCSSTKNASTSEISDFITIWKTTTANERITIPTNATVGEYNYSVDWGDASVDTELKGNAQHEYAQAGTYTIKISGVFPAIYFMDLALAYDGTAGSDESFIKIFSIENWGNIEWATMSGAFFGCANLQVNAQDSPNLLKVRDMSYMFCYAESLHADFNDWNVSNVHNMSGLFCCAQAFNGDISTWNVSKVTDMSGMFYEARSFNADIRKWNVSKVTTMRGMFSFARSFNADIRKWNVSKVTDTSAMFGRAESFANHDLSTWNVRNVVSYENFLSDAGLGNTEPNWPKN